MNTSLNKLAIGQFILYWRGQYDYDKQLYKELQKVYIHYYRHKLIRRINSTPRFLCLGKDLPKTNVEVARVWLKIGDNSIYE